MHWVVGYFAEGLGIKSPCVKAGMCTIRMTMQRRDKKNETLEAFGGGGGPVTKHL